MQITTCRQVIIWIKVALLSTGSLEALQQNRNRNWNIFIQENIFENGICQMPSIFSQLKYKFVLRTKGSPFCHHNKSDVSIWRRTPSLRNTQLLHNQVEGWDFLRLYGGLSYKIMLENWLHGTKIARTFGVKQLRLTWLFCAEMFGRNINFDLHLYHSPQRYIGTIFHINFQEIWQMLKSWSE